MTTSKNRNIVFGQMLMEFLLLNLSLLVVFFTSSNSMTSSVKPNETSNHYLLLLLLVNLGWILALTINGDLGSYLSKNIRRRIKFLLLNSLLLVGFVNIVMYLVLVDFIGQTTLILTTFLFFCLDLVLIRLWNQFYSRRRENRTASRVLMVGGKNNWQQLPEFAETVQHHGYQVIGCVESKLQDQVGSPFPVSGRLNELSNVLASTPVDEIFIGLSSMEEEELRYAVQTADYHGVRVNLVPDTPNFLTINFKPSTVEDLPVYRLRKSPLDQFNNYLIKKIFDFVFASLMILLLSPVFLIISILIFIESRGPIFYTPIRKGEKGASFKCYKFRTMSVCDDPVNGRKSTEKNDPRITLVGRFLRKHDLDELPQFFNVVKGDMSVVGPRPHRVFLHNDFRKIVNEYMVRHYVKPGITGWAQVNGWRGPTKTIEQKKERVKHDLWYIENWSFWLDLKIVWLTAFGKKTRKNAF